MSYFFSCKFFFPIFGHKTLDPDLILIDIQPKMHPDPDSMNTDPKHWSQLKHLQVRIPEKGDVTAA
jgi:hypothetical protein